MSKKLKIALAVVLAVVAAVAANAFMVEKPINLNDIFGATSAVEQPVEAPATEVAK